MDKLVLDPFAEHGSTERVSTIMSLLAKVKKLACLSFIQAQGASCLEYEWTIPSKFMVGTEQG